MVVKAALSRAVLPPAVAAALVVATLAAATPAGAVQQPITGRLSAKGYRLIALGENGRATSVRLVGSTFSLRPPAARVTLQLRTPGGRYAGPVVVGGDGKRVVVGVRAGARLGTIRLRNGHATLTRRPAARSIDPTWTARARAGVPLGAGRVGLVRATLPRTGAPGDRDRDGVPNPIDIDDDGDRILDDYDRKSSVARAAVRPGSNVEVVTLLGWSPVGFVNAEGDARADGSPHDEAQVAADLAAAEAAGGVVGVFWGSEGSGKSELDCTGLSYCSPGGTGVLASAGTPPPPDQNVRAGRPSFPECCDEDRDGMGSLTADRITVPDGNGMFILHGASSDQIHAGDVLIARDTENAGLQFPASVGFVFASHPVFATYDDGQGNRVTLSYPFEAACRPNGCQRPVRAGPDGDLVIRFTVWRPQRPRLATEPGSGRWMDVGNLAYATSVQTGPTAPPFCPRSAYQQTDPSLVPLAAPAHGNVPVGQAFADTSPDFATEPRGDAGHSFGFTLNVSACYRAAGVTTLPGSVPLKLHAYAIGADYPNPGASESSSQLLLWPRP